MFEGRMQEYKESLADGAKAHLSETEQVRVVALAQERVPGWVQSVPYALVGVGFVSSFSNDLLPIAASIALMVIGVAGIALSSTLIPRRMLVRTDERLYVFNQPSSRKSEVEAPLSSHVVEELPPGSASSAPSLAGVIYYPSFGASGEKEAISAALSPRTS